MTSLEQYIRKARRLIRQLFGENRLADVPKELSRLAFEMNLDQKIVNLPKIKQIRKEIGWVASHTLNDISANALQDIRNKFDNKVFDTVKKYTRKLANESEINQAIKRLGLVEERYIRTINNSIQMAMGRAGAVEQSTKLGTEWFRYDGPKTGCRKFCADHLGKIYNISEIEQMNNGQGLPVLYFMGGYNCRHRWVPVIITSQNIEQIDDPIKREIERYKLKISNKEYSNNVELPQIPDISEEELRRSWGDNYDKAKNMFPNKLITKKQFTELFAGDFYEDKYNASFYFDNQMGSNSLFFTYRTEKIIIRRDFSKEEKFVHHDFYKINDRSEQKKGSYAKTFLMQLALYKANGYDLINIFADIDVGCWAWGRYGFKILNRDYGDRIYHLADKLKISYNEIDDIFLDNKYFYDCCIELSNIYNIPLKKIKKTIIKEKISWEGYFDLLDEEQLERSIIYSNKKMLK